MKQMLSKLYSSKINTEDEKPENNEKKQELRSEIDRYYNILWNNLDSDSRIVLDKLMDSHAKLVGIEKENSFIRGFSTAVKIMTEALSE